MNIENLENEIWAVHPLYTDYAASNYGRIKHITKKGIEKLNKLTPNDGGYLQLHIYQDGKTVDSPLVHRFVWECFHQELIPKDRKKYQINHINEDKTDNRVFENLELVSAKENANYGTRNKRVAEAQSKQVGQYNLNGNLVKVWESTAECGRNGFIQQAVSACCRNCFNREGNNIYKNFIWRYIDNI